MTGLERRWGRTLKEARFPPKAVDANKLPDPDGFWNLKVRDAERLNAIRLGQPKDMGDIIFFLNMAAEGWASGRRSLLAAQWGPTIHRASAGRFIDAFEPLLLKAVKLAVPRKSVITTGGSHTGLWVRVVLPESDEYADTAWLNLTLDTKFLHLEGGEGDTGHNPFDWKWSLERVLMGTPESLAKLIRARL